MENLKIIVEISARHIHLSKEHLETLFGEGYELTHKKDLSQPGQFACEERVSIKGPKGSFPGVSILGPVRSATQFELSLTDSRTLGIKAPIRESGDVADSADLLVGGPKGEIEIKSCAIVAKRHVHITPQEAIDYNLGDKEIVLIKIVSADRSLIFDDVVVRVSPKFQTRMHLDTDEAQAAGISGEVTAEVIKK